MTPEAAARRGAAAHVLAGDIGGTKTALAIHAVDAAGTVTLVRDRTFASRDYAGLEEVIAAFLVERDERIASAAFGIAGPVVDDAVITTNLPWRIERRRLSEGLGGAPVRLMNDLESTAYGALFLPPDDVVTLSPGVARPGHRAVIAAGTGLGQAFLYHHGDHYTPVATEGGHADFAPCSPLEDDLLAFLRSRFGRVSYERIVSGPGLQNVFHFLDERLGRPVAPEIRARMAHEDPSAVIGAAAVAGASPTCREAVDLFLSVYGAQAGNLALTVMATGGVYVAGGIVAKLLPLLPGSAFMHAFVAKGRYEALMSEIPVWVIVNPRTALIGAVHAAIALLAGDASPRVRRRPRSLTDRRAHRTGRSRGTD
ncbi:MAG: glucokinase [Deltaproteobacteria bacterium]|nr:glucokinase [Deltaproteobacteria bacterium]